MDNQIEPSVFENENTDIFYNNNKIQEINKNILSSKSICNINNYKKDNFLHANGKEYFLTKFTTEKNEINTRGNIL